MAEESDKKQLQQSGNNHTAHALYASGSIYAETKVGVATKIQNIGPAKTGPTGPLATAMFFSEEVITHSLGEGFCIHKILLPQAIVIQFKTRSTAGVNVLGRIYENLIS